MKIEISKSKVFSDVLIIEPDYFQDHRGILYSTYLKKEFQKHISKDLEFNHNKIAYNYKNVLRGIHGDFSSWKMVTCIYGSIFQVVVDYRKDSKTYLKYDKFEISDIKPKQILIPPGFGNAFYVLSDVAVYNYQLSYDGSYNDYDKQFTIKWDDKRININWPTNNPILSERDK